MVLRGTVELLKFASCIYAPKQKTSRLAVSEVEAEAPRAGALRLRLLGPPEGSVSRGDPAPGGHGQYSCPL